MKRKKQKEKFTYKIETLYQIPKVIQIKDKVDLSIILISEGTIISVILKVKDIRIDRQITTIILESKKNPAFIVE